MRRFSTLALLLFAVSVNAQKMNKTIEDPLKNRTVLIDPCTRAAIVNFPEMKVSYDVEYPAYTPDSNAVSSMKRLMADKKITIVLGTWCGDSKLQVPRFLKLLDALAVPEKDVTFICVDGHKKTDDGSIDRLRIERVPTFIFYEKKKELGRITESPVISLEQDMLLTLVKK